MNNRETTLAYLRDWLDWVERGAPNWQPYPRDEGLCGSVCWYMIDDDTVYTEEKLHAIDAAIRYTQSELAVMFAEDGLARGHPFGRAAFWRAEQKDTMHLGRKRVAWVRNKLQLALAKPEEPC